MPSSIGIYRLDWVDFQDWKNEAQYRQAYERLLDSFDKEVVAEGNYAHILSELKPIDFGVEIANLIHDFMGREWYLKS